MERRKWCVSSMLANVRADARRDTRRGRFGGARAVRRRGRTLGRAWGRRAAHWHVVGDALCLPRAHKQRRTIVREAEAGGSGGKARQGSETANEVCNRASGARCAGVPNLGWIGGELVDFLPQLCGGMCGRAQKLDGVGKIADLQGTTESILRMSGRDSPTMSKSQGRDSQSLQGHGRASSDLESLPTERLPTHPAGG